MSFFAQVPRLPMSPGHVPALQPNSLRLLQVSNLPFAVKHDQSMESFLLATLQTCKQTLPVVPFQNVRTSPEGSHFSGIASLVLMMQMPVFWLYSAILQPLCI
jgi:hypothetical protein